MSRTIRQGFPVQKQPRAQNVDHSPDDRRHHHPTNEPGMNDARKAEKHHHKH